MKKKYIYISLSLAIIIAAAILLSRQSNSTLDKQFYIADTSNVTKIFLADKEDHTTTLTKSGSVWILDDETEAIQDNVELLLRTMLHIEIKHPLSKSANQAGLKQLLTHHTKVEIYQEKGLFTLFGMEFFKKERLSKVYYVGGPTQDNKGTLMKLEDEDILYITHLPGMNGYLTERFSAVPSDWKSHELFAIPVLNVRSATFEFPETPEESFKIVNNLDRTFTVQRHPSGEIVPVYDTLKVLQIIASFGKINFESALESMSDKRIDSLKASTPFRILSLETTDGEKHRLDMYHRRNYEQILDLDGNPFPYDVDRMYAFKNNSREAVSVQFFVMDEVGRKLSTIVPKQFQQPTE